MPGTELGAARTAHGDAADQVKLHNFYVPAQGWYVLRPYDSNVAAQNASLMITACNNDNIVFSEEVGRGTSQHIFTQGVYTNSKTYTDCSGLISYITRQTTGNSNFNYTSGNMATALENTGYYMDRVKYTDGMTLYAGDVLVKVGGGHCAMVTNGNIRSGTNAELLTSMDNARGFTTDWSGYNGAYGTGSAQEGVQAALNGSMEGWLLGQQGPTYGLVYGDGRGAHGMFEPRLVEPVIEPVDEYLPEELIEMIELGLIFKEELEDFYDMYYIYEGRGGYSPFEDVPLTNRTYAWNRFAEVLDMQESCALPQGSPGSWVMGAGEYTVDMAPELGAAMCFSGPGGGYACIIEDILANEVLLTSQVENGGWSLKERVKRYGMWDFDEYMFVGFIHNPGASMGAEDESALETFLRIAEGAVGQGQSWVLQHSGIIGPNGWSGAFVTACSKRAGSSLNIVIPNVDSVSTIGRVGVLRGMGTWKKGSIYGGGYNPSAGDIAIFRYEHTGKENMYKGDKAAIVVESDGGSFEGVMGDDGGVVTKKSYSCSTPYIAGYFCPNWEMIDGTTASKKEYRNIQGLYTNGVTKYDACARTVCYMNSNYKPSIGTSKVKLAAVNYTGLLANFYSVFGQASISTATDAELVVDFWTNTVRSYYQRFPGDFNGVCGEVATMTGAISTVGMTSSLGVNSAGLANIGFYSGNTQPANVNVTNVVQECYNYIRSLGYNHAIACGILANIQAESGFNTGIHGDNGTSAGLMQWHLSRMTAMQQHAGSNWASNIEGQLDYGLNVEVKTGQDQNMINLRNALDHIENTPDGAEQAAAAWIRYFERPKGFNPEKADYNPDLYKTRQEYAAGFYQSISGN